MAEAKSTPPPASRDRMRRLARAALRAIPRVYAVAVIVVTGWLSYRALAYLVVSLFTPARAPAQITEIPTHLDEAVLQTRRTAWRGVEASAYPRVPPARYHRIDGWIQPDRFNGCTRAGCHRAFPHARRPEVRAFLNMHATSVHCGVCHLQGEAEPLAAAWYSLDSGRRRSAPTVLQVFGWMSSDEGRRQLAEPSRAEQTRLVSLLRAAAREGDDEPALREMADHFAAVRHAGPDFQRLVEAAREALPRRFRGEYGAKLALVDRATGGLLLNHPGTETAVRAYLREADTADESRRAALLADVHPRRRPQALHCTDCHRAEKPLLDFAAAGYPPARIEMLTTPVVFRMIERIASGQPFYLPGFVSPAEESGEERPGSSRP